MTGDYCNDCDAPAGCVTRCDCEHRSVCLGRVPHGERVLDCRGCASYLHLDIKTQTDADDEANANWHRIKLNNLAHAIRTAQRWQ